jgi:hypothetical protein
VVVCPSPLLRGPIPANVGRNALQPYAFPEVGHGRVMVGQEWSQLLASAGLVLAALMILVAVIRAKLLLALSGLALMGITIAVRLDAERTGWANDVLALLILIAAFLLVIMLTRNR